ncbi:MAG TPA: hypothetical protein PLQ70_10535 [Flavobacterium alvei]|nr:hypothetical protein [Flavobacterium alvei]
MKVLITVLLLFSFNISSYSQVDNFQKKYTSEIIFLKDLNLKNLIKEIIKKDSYCKTEGLDWYIDFMKDDIILISKNSIGNLIAARGINQIYTTTIDDKILFIINAENINDTFIKSGYLSDLSSFIDKSNYSTIDYSFWVIQKNEKNKYKIIKEKIYRCK